MAPGLINLRHTPTGRWLVGSALQAVGDGMARLLTDSQGDASQYRAADFKRLRRILGDDWEAVAIPERTEADAT